jgi:hypothetical protein
MRAALLAGLLGLAPQDAPVTITVVDADSGKPIFARVVLRDAAGQVLHSTGYKTLNGRFVPPDGWAVSLPKGRYSVRADAGFEFFARSEEWAFDGAPEKKIELRRWVHFRKGGWFPGGDHNHLIRGGAENKNYGGTTVTLQFAAALHASRGWAYYQSGGGGPWIVDGNPQPLHQGRRTEAAAAEWNRKYGEHLHLGWNNEILKTRYGHVWFLGACPSGPAYPYTDKPGDAWWAFYDDSWDPWQTGDKSKPIGPYTSGLWELPPVFDCIRDWRDRGLVSIYAHPTRTFTIGKNRVSNIAVEFPFDLLAGAPVGGLAVMGDAPDHAEDQALWFAALNEGYAVPGVAENDTVYGSETIRSGPFVTYTSVPDMGSPFNPAKLAAALGAGRNFVSSGAFCLLKADGKYGPGDAVPEDGRPHALEVRAWASADPSDAIESLDVVADGKTVERVSAASGKREFSGTVTVKGVRWALAKVVCKNRAHVAITNPVYFRKPGEPLSPPPLRATVRGRATAGGAGVPAEIVVTAWGKEVSRSKAGDDGAYRLEGVPLAAHLTFTHAGRSARRTALFHDPRIAAIHAKTWATDFVGTPGALAGVFPPRFFDTLRELAREVTIDAELSVTK